MDELPSHFRPESTIRNRQYALLKVGALCMIVPPVLSYVFEIGYELASMFFAVGLLWVVSAIAALRSPVRSVENPRLNNGDMTIGEAFQEVRRLLRGERGGHHVAHQSTSYSYSPVAPSASENLNA